MRCQRGFLKSFLVFLLVGLQIFPYMPRAFANGTVGSGALPSSSDIRNASGGQVSNTGAVAPGGAYGFAYPLELPPALLMPALSLSYSSSSRYDYEMPYGWSLNIPSIQRLDGQYAENEFRLSSDAFNGILRPSRLHNGQYVLWSSSHGQVVAVLENGLWTVKGAGFVYTFEKPVAKPGLNYWRIKNIRDVTGNSIDYHYTPEGRIDFIAYGGTADGRYEHHAKVVFTYHDSLQANFYMTASYGYPMYYDRLVNEIMIYGPSNPQAESTGLASAWLKSYRLVYEEDIDALPAHKLAGIEEKVSNTEIMKMVAFDYTSYEEPTRQPAAGMFDKFANFNGEKCDKRGCLYQNSKTYSEMYVDNDNHVKSRAVTILQELMIDLNGDGMLDYLSQRTGDGVPNDLFWAYQLMRYDATRQSFVYSPMQTGMAPMNGLGVVNTPRLEDYNAPQGTLHQSLFRDINGDGYTDMMVCSEMRNRVLYGDGVEDSVYPFFENEFVEYPALPADLRDDSNGQHIPATGEQSPFRHEVSCLRSIPANIQTNQDLYYGLDYEYADMNGDGWLDIVQYRKFNPDDEQAPAVPGYNHFTQAVYFHTAQKNGGWQAHPHLAPSRAYRFNGMVYSQRHGDFIDEYGTQINYVSVDTGCEVVRHADINGDGYMDEILSAKGIEAFNRSNADFGDRRDIENTESDIVFSDANNWAVVLGSNDGMTRAYHEWNVPDDYLVQWDQEQDSCISSYAEHDLLTGGGEISRLMDMDLDGLPDLVVFDTERTNVGADPMWFKNRGNGFDDIGNLLDPDLFAVLTQNKSLTLSSIRTDEFIGHSYGAYFGDAAANNGNVDNSNISPAKRTISGVEILPPSQFAGEQVLDNHWLTDFNYEFITKTYTHQDFVDVNGDGVADFIDTLSPHDEETKNPSLTTYKPDLSLISEEAPLPALLLSKIRQFNGLKTDIAYKRLKPSFGDRSLQGMVVVDSVTSTDPFTGQTKSDTYNFSYPRYVHNIFIGFDRFETRSYVGGIFQHRVLTTNELQDPNHPENDLYFGTRVKNVQVYGDKNHVYAPHSTSGGQVSEYLASESEYSYGFKGLESNLHVLTSLLQSDYGEWSRLPKHTLKNEMTYVYNLAGLVASIFSDYDGNQNDIGQNVDYQLFDYPAMDGVPDIAGAFFAWPQIVSVRDSAGIERQKNEYHWSTSGLTLEWQKTYTGRVDEGESVAASFIQQNFASYTPRGLPLESNVQGSQVVSTIGYGYNGSLPVRVSSSDGEHYDYTLDKWGRSQAVYNRNQSNATLTYDNFGRPKNLQVRGKTIQTFEYYNQSVKIPDKNWESPNWIQVNNVLAGTSVRVYVDGSGNVLESIVDAAPGFASYISESFLYDLNGRLLMTLAPETVSDREPKADYSSAGHFGLTQNNALPSIREKVAGLSYYDGFNLSRETYSNYRHSDTPLILKHNEGNSYQMRRADKESLLITDLAGNPREIRYIDNSNPQAPQTVMGRYEYDALANIKKFTNRAGDEFLYNYDAIGRLTGSRMGSVVDYTYHYNALGLMERMENSAGDQLLWSYDAFDRLASKSVSHPSGSPVDYVYTYYDENASGKAGLLRSVTDGHNGETIYDYYPHSEALMSIERRIDGLGSPLRYGFVYGDNEQLAELSTPSGSRVNYFYEKGSAHSELITYPNKETRTLTFKYDELARSKGFVYTSEDDQKIAERNIEYQDLSGRVEMLETIMGSNDIIFSEMFDYNNEGYLSDYMRYMQTGAQDESVTERYSYNALNELSEIAQNVSLSDGNLSLSSIFSFEYEDGNIKKIMLKDQLRPGMPQIAQQVFGWLSRFNDSLLNTQYGPLGRLESFSGGNADVANELLYDAAGRVSVWNHTDASNKDDELKKQVYGYDGTGRLSNIDIETYDGNYSVQYERDAGGKTFKNNFSDENGSYLKLDFAGWQYDSQMGITAESLMPFETYVINNDTGDGFLQGSLHNYKGEQLATTDPLNALIEEQNFDFDGEFLKQHNTAIKHTNIQDEGYHGMPFNGMTGLSDMNQRHLMPEIGYWLQPEPLLYLSPSSTLSPQKVLPYRYAANDPINYSDRSGFSPGGGGNDECVGAPSIVDCIWDKHFRNIPYHPALGTGVGVGLYAFSAGFGARVKILSRIPYANFGVVAGLMIMTMSIVQWIWSRHGLYGFDANNLLPGAPTLGELVTDMIKAPIEDKMGGMLPAIPKNGPVREGWERLWNRVFRGRLGKHQHHAAQQSLGGRMDQRLHDVDQNIHSREHPDSIPNLVDKRLDESGFPKGSHPNTQNGSREEFKDFFDKNPNAYEPAMDGQHEALEKAIARGDAPAKAMDDFLNEMMNKPFE